MNLGLASFLLICVVGLYVLIFNAIENRHSKNRVFTLSIISSIVGIVFLVGNTLVTGSELSMNTWYLILFFMILCSISLYNYFQRSDERV